MKFLFVIAETPAAKLTAVRRDLVELSRTSLLQQTSGEWSAVFLGEEEKTEGKFRWVRTPADSKEKKLHFFADWIRAQHEQPEYIIRFDDDDLINPSALQQLEGKSFDCFADRYHWFYDLASGAVSAQRRHWLANTVVHKAAHALTPYGEYHNGVSDTTRKPVLLQNDHSKTWHTFYRDRNVLWSRFGSPLYLRILSPGSITAGNSGEYQSYLSSFGYWKDNLPSDFQPYAAELKAIWHRHFGELRRYEFSNKGYFRSRLLRMLGK
jgi:hypothetical protein